MKLIFKDFADKPEHILEIGEPKISVETNLYDKVERYTNCIVEVLTNTATGETSVGWYRTDETEEV